MQQLLVILSMGCAQITGVNHILAGALILMMVSFLPLWLAFVSFSSRLLRLDSQASLSTDSPKPIYLGHPRLLATQVSHTRLGPGQYNYTVPHFLVGTPVGLNGRVGNVLSLDEKSSATQTGGFNSPFSGSWLSKIRQYLSIKTWFTVHAHHHLEKGNDSIGLQGKLRHFLQSQGEDPDEWKYAYLVTMPQFLGYQRNLVCFWYLYSASRELTGMVMEVNNYWGQRKIAFSRLIGEAPLSSPSSCPSPEMPSGSATYPVNFHYSNPRYHTYRGTWNKDMFISPFEKVEGSIALRFSDPLAPQGNLQITITLLGTSGKARLIGRVFCPGDHESLDLLVASPWRLFRFLPYWTVVLVLTELLIIAAALRIRSRGAHFYAMPEVRPNNLPRDESDIERKLEAPFRHYLKRLVEHSHAPVRLHYIPSKSHILQPATFTSSSCADDTPTLVVQVLAPQFYTSVTSYQDAIIAFTAESRSTSLPSDPSSRSLAISDPNLLFSLLSSSAPSTSDSDSKSFSTLFRTWLRGTPEASFLDRFVAMHLQRSAQKEYQSSVLTHLLADRVALGSHGLVGAYAALAYLSLQAGISYFLVSAWSAVLGTAVAPTAMLCHWLVLKGWNTVGS